MKELLNMPEGQYRSLDAVNFSTLSKMLKSPKAYKYALDNPSSASAAMQFGSAFHMRVLEPAKYFAEYLIEPKCDKRTIEGKKAHADFLAKSMNSKIVSAQDAELISKMYDELSANSLVKSLLSDGNAEATLLWKDAFSGFDMKAKLDYVKDGSTIIDLKTTYSATKEGFTESVDKYNYDMQAAIYLSGLHQLSNQNQMSFIWVCIESTPPYSIATYQASAETIKSGIRKFQYCTSLLTTCLKTNEWPDITRFLEEI